MKILAAISLLLLAAAAQAEAIAPITPDEVAALRAKIKTLDAEVAQARKAAADQFAARNAACYKKVLVSACLDQSRKEDVKARVAIRQQEADIKRLEREIRLREDVTRKAQAEETAPAREAEAAAKAERSREENEKREAEFEARQAEHRRREEEGKQRAAEDAAARAKRDAELARERERKAAAARERAAHTPPPPTSGTKPYVAPAIDIPAAPSSIAPKR